MTTIDQSRDAQSGTPLLSRGAIMVSLGLAAWVLLAVAAYLVYRGITG